MDARKSYSSIDEHIPFLNQSVFLYGRELYTKQGEVRSNKFDVRFGYQFFQHGSQPEWDYWYVDSLENNGVSILSGFQTHSALIGAKWSNSKYSDSDKENRTPLARNTIEIDYLFGFYIRLKGFHDFGVNQESVEIANTYKFNRHGIRFAYKYEHFITKHSSLYTQVDVLYAPFIEYAPNKNMFTPRGGERILPLFPSLKVGINVFKHP